jgi:hypothetical protein
LTRVTSKVVSGGGLGLLVRADGTVSVDIVS